MSNPISRILVVDHNRLLREGLSSLIRHQANMDLVGVATSASEAVLLFKTLKPDAVVMDLDLPDAGGIKSLREIRGLDAGVCIIGILTHPGDDSAMLAFQEGVHGCIGKNCLDTDLVPLIRECLRTNHL